MGEEIGWPAPHRRAPNPFARKFCVMWNKTLQKLLDEGQIRTHPQVVRDAGLEGVLEGLQDIREKKISGQKLTYTL
jgi:hypothetical protein